MIELFYSGLEELEDREKSALDITLAALFEVEEIPGPGEISLSFVSGERIRELNRDYRGIDRETDVLSFPQYASKEELLMESYQVLGDIIINMDRVRLQAEEYGHGILRELVYLSIHSFYHLLGYDHEDDASKKVMRRKEEGAYSLVEEKI